MDSPLLIVVGPTAAGKSGLALHVAELFSGEVVNCDSLQLYRGFDIGTAKTPARERRGIPHHLLDVLDPQMVHSAGDYSRLARATVAEIAQRGKLPVIVGGTGFYLSAFLNGLPALPPRDEGLRERLSEREQQRPGSLHRILSRVDPATLRRIQPNDTHKLLRALEIRLLTRRTLPPASEAAPLTGFRILKIGLDPDREALVKAIEARTANMFEAGLLEEVRGLLASGLTGNEKPFESLGYKQVLAHFRGELSIETAILNTEIGTRQYAKRQRTWFRRDPQIHWLPGFGSDPRIVEQATELVKYLLATPCDSSR
ncbi:MAG: tRNA (adenosine(37)-N6)-dimethylallyltransferase MiaA [Acidobacteriota bacterium]